MVMGKLEQKFVNTFGIFCVVKVLYICRLFNGLEQSIIDEEWSPTGVPTIFRMIDKLNRSKVELKLILTVKDGFSMLNLSQNRDVCLQGFSRPVTVLKNHAQKNKKPIYKILREFAHCLHIFRQIFIFKPDIVYFDHGNVWCAGIVSRMIKQPVIFRVMGVYPAMRETVNTAKPSLFQRVLRWCYRSPFSLVISTQDGSGVEDWLDKALDHRVKVFTLLNGLPEISRNYKSASLRSVIAVSFLGKLEKAKGADVFVEAMLKVAGLSGQKFKFYLVGTGSLEASLRLQIDRSRHRDCFEIINRLENNKVSNFLKKTDIYVSLNKYGNLSNANLEAVAEGCCMILPSSQASKGIDVITDQLLGSDAVFRLTNDADCDELAKAVIKLAALPEKRQEMSQNVLRIGRSLPSWKERIDFEFNEILKLRVVDG